MTWILLIAGLAAWQEPAGGPLIDKLLTRLDERQTVLESRISETLTALQAATVERETLLRRVNDSIADMRQYRDEARRDRQSLRDTVATMLAEARQAAADDRARRQEWLANVHATVASWTPGENLYKAFRLLLSLVIALTILAGIVVIIVMLRYAGDIVQIVKRLFGI